MTKKLLALAAASGFLAVLGSGALAQSSQGLAPGARVQEHGTVQGTTGVSGSALGHQTQGSGSIGGSTGTSINGPGHVTTGGSSNSGVSVRGGGMGATTNGAVGGKVRR